MDQSTLVEMQLDDGQRLIERLAAEGIPVTAAAWLRERESGQWFLYLATPLVGEDGATRPAYRRVNTLIREMQKEGFWIDPFEIKLISSTDPLAQALAEIHRRYPGKVPTRYGGTQLGGMSIEGAYIYPPVTASV